MSHDGFLGMDIAQIQQLTGDLRAEANRIQTTAASVEKLIDAAGWVGPDAEAFRENWRTTVNPMLAQLSDRMRQAALSTSTGLEQQMRASGR